MQINVDIVLIFICSMLRLSLVDAKLNNANDYAASGIAFNLLLIGNEIEIVA